LFTGRIDEPVFHDVIGATSEDEFYKSVVWHETLNRAVIAAVYFPLTVCGVNGLLVQEGA